MRRKHVMAAVATLAVVLMASRATRAVIKVEMPIGKIYDVSKTVIVGTVTGINQEKRVAQVKVDQTLKGEAIGDKIQVQVAAPVDLLAAVGAGVAGGGGGADGSRVVLFVAKAKGGTTALAHLADTWLLAELVPNAVPPTWRVTGTYGGSQTFPGSTAALARAVGELQAGRNPMLDRMEQFYFRGDVRRLGKLNVAKPTWLMAVHVAGNSRLDLLIGTAAGVRLFTQGHDARPPAGGDGNASGGFEDATERWGLSAAADGFHAAGQTTASGRPDLFLGERLWINDGQKFTASKAKFDLSALKGKPLAAGIAAAPDPAKTPAIMLATTDGELLIFDHPGAPDKPWLPRTTKPTARLWPADSTPPAWAAFGNWGDDGRPCLLAVRESGVTRYALDQPAAKPADFQRLTGVKLQQYYERYRDGLAHPVAAAIDINGSGRPSLFVLCDTGGLMLVNRGYGAFLIDYDAAGPLARPTEKDPKRPPVLLTASTPVAAADTRGDGFQDLLVLTEDGQLFDVVNRPPATQPSHE